MQPDLAKNKFVFFKSKDSFVEGKYNKLLPNIVIIFYFFYILSFFALFTPIFSGVHDSKLLKSSVVKEAAAKKEVVAVTKKFADENVDVLKYLSKIDNTFSQGQIKKHFSNYDVSFKEFKPMTGFLKKENLLIYFDLTSQISYISFNGMNLSDAYELKKTFDSVSYDYQSKVILERDSISIVISNDKSVYGLELPLLPVSKISEIKNTMSMITPLTPKLKEVSELNKLQEKLESVKIDNLIIQEKIKQRELLKKLSNI